MIESVASLKSLGVMFDEKISWDSHFHLTESKVSNKTKHLNIYTKQKFQLLVLFLFSPN